MADHFIDAPHSTEQKKMEDVQLPSNSCGMSSPKEAVLCDSNLELSSILSLMSAITIAHEEVNDESCSADKFNAAKQESSSINIKEEERLNCTDINNAVGNGVNITNSSAEEMIMALEGLVISNSSVEDQIATNTNTAIPRQPQAASNAMLQFIQYFTFCNNCQEYVVVNYHCAVCDGFNLCPECYERDGHPHEMEKIDFNFDDESLPNNRKQTNLEEIRRLPIQHCIRSFVHACQCQDFTCRLSSCQKMKRIVTHTKACKKKTDGGCPICKRLSALCCYHAKQCQESNCPIPFCSNIKHKLKWQAQQEKRQQVLLKRRLTVANGTCNTQSSNATLPTTQFGDDKKKIDAPLMLLQSQFNTPAMQNSTSNGNMVLKQTLQRLIQILRLPPSPDRQHQILQTLKSNPLLMRAFTMQQQKSQQTQVDNGQRQDVSPLARFFVNEQYLQQLIQLVRLPPSPEHQEKIIQILKSNPRFMAAFIKHRQKEQQQAQLSGGNAQNVSPTKTPDTAGVSDKQQLMQTLGSSQYAEQQQKILQTLRSTSKLMAAFTKQRQTQYEQSGGAQMVGTSSHQPHCKLSQLQNPPSQSGIHSALLKARLRRKFLSQQQIGRRPPFLPTLGPLGQRMMKQQAQRNNDQQQLVLQQRQQQLVLQQRQQQLMEHRSEFFLPPPIPFTLQMTPQQLQCYKERQLYIFQQQRRNLQQQQQKLMNEAGNLPNQSLSALEPNEEMTEN